ncbi:glycine--tRNA ligase subunit beta [Pusillimonas sp. NJUB218]|uniref:glycine--tRNA ligase subunit beta n=1 Tax=Pusillimonas sp. NJUB218 TaxID=2023230 RepID=UPI000F4C104D|nr:glycine--tRNA ligase subunit beta [Pusillimonas sp. NJUB218]ROT45939.1 glycine--tRNA ligase subunit beta [Pusillimonas sp. NJUB218]
MTTAQVHPLLVELVTEELPPKALNKLGKAFAEGISSVLAKKQLLSAECKVIDYATPRRLAVHLSHVLDQAPEQAFTEKLMPAKVGLTPDGQATPALVKKLESKGLGHLQPADLISESDGKQDYLYAKGTAPGASLPESLQEALEAAIAGLPIPKVMRYQLDDGKTSVKFVRPAHHLVALHGANVVPIATLGLNADRVSNGHRFMGKATLSITSPDTYVAQLADEGKVIASFDDRRSAITQQLAAQAAALGGTIGQGPEVDALLDEVTALVEHPTVYAGQFDPKFLAVPSECLILTMRLNQKYFPLFEPTTGKLTHRFLIVSNMQVADPRHIIEGNERVVRPRLADAQFFFDTDRKSTLESRVESLANRVYHNKLGSQRDRIERVRAIARYVAAQLGGNEQHADRAALLAKADLNSNMVGEFPELQGIMGAYYAQGDNEPADVVTAIGEQYRIRLDEPVNASSLTSAILFIAERAETLVGIWGIGLVPSGERDPYGLRRAALGLISAFEQLAAGDYIGPGKTGTLALRSLLDKTAETFSQFGLAANTVDDVTSFIYERYRNQLGADHDRNVVDAVLSLEPPLHEVQARVAACSSFAQMPEAQSLAAANKRITNLLKKADHVPDSVDTGKLAEPAEQALAAQIAQVEPEARRQFADGDFAGSLATLSHTRNAVDQFFNDVMVMAEDLEVRNNRLALLGQLGRLMNQVADISRLAQ